MLKAQAISNNVSEIPGAAAQAWLCEDISLRVNPAVGSGTASSAKADDRSRAVKFFIAVRVVYIDGRSSMHTAVHDRYRNLCWLDSVFAS